MREGIEATFPRLWRYALAQTGRRDWADDLAQATCLRAIENAEKFEVGTKLDRWLFTIARRVWLNQLRSQKLRQSDDSVSVEELSDSNFQTAETNIFAREVLGRVEALPEGQRLAVLLVYVEGYKYADAAEHLDVPIGTIMSRLATARRTLSEWAGQTKRVSK